MGFTLLVDLIVICCDEQKGFQGVVKRCSSEELQNTKTRPPAFDVMTFPPE